MRGENFPQPKFIGDYEKPSIEAKLWEKAEELFIRKKELNLESNKLYEEINQGTKSSPNLHEIEVLAKKEKRYWSIQQAIGAIDDMEKELQEAIEKLDAGQLSYEELTAFVDLGGSEENESKRRLAIKRENDRYLKLLKSRGVTDGDIALDPYLFSLRSVEGPRHVPGGPNATRLTTGRQQKRIKGGEGLNEFNAGDEFFYRTADTHGGKVNVEKKGDRYVSKGGKTIRKK